MSFVEKHNHVGVEDYPTYKAEFMKAKELCDGNTYPVTWCGAFDGNYGRECYVDIVKDEKHIRVHLPNWLMKDIESISRDADDMADIKAGKIMAEFQSFKTKSGYTSTRVVWSEVNLPF